MLDIIYSFLILWDCMGNSSLTIIDNKNLRGVLAPAEVISKELLEDIIDFIELSSPGSVRETEERVEEADRDNSWILAEEVEKRVKARANTSE